MQGDITHSHVSLAILLIPLLAVLVGASLWSWLLRKQVARRTKDLVSEIDAHAQAEERIRHLNSVLRAVRNVNQLITRVKDRDTLIANACELLVETRGCDSAWLGLLDDNRKPARSAQAGLDDVFDELLEQMESGNLNVCSKRALKRAGVAVIDHPESRCGDCPLLGQQPGFGALTVRLEHEGRIFGLLSVEIPDRLVFDDEEQQLVNEIADDIAFALYAMDAREEHERLDQALRASERRLIAAQHIAGMGDFTWDVGTGEVTWSDALFDLLGYDKSDIIDYSRVNAEIHHPDELDRVTQWLTDCIASGEDELTPNEYRIIRKDGEVLFVRTIGVIEREEGKSAKVFATLQDITERKRAERLLEAREEFLNRVIEQSPFAIWISDSEGTLQRANPALKRFLNLTDEQLVGKYNVLHDPVVERQGLIPLIRTVYEESKSVSFTCDWDGEDIPTLDLKGSSSVSIEATMFPIHNPEGDLTNVVLSWIDISERKRAEEELRESEERLELAVAGSNGGLWHMALNPDDPDHTLPDEIYLSPRLKAIIGYEDDEFPNSMAAWDSHIIPEDLPRLRERMREHMEGRVDLHDAEYRMYHKDGSIRWIHTRGRVQRDEHGRAIWFAGIDWDITERKRAEEEVAWLAKFPSEDPNPVLRVGRDGTLLYANAAAFPLLNCWQCQVGGSLPERWRDLAAQVLKTEAGADAEVEVGDRTLSLTFAPVVDAEYVNTYGLDVTERKQANDALRESEERYRRIFNDSAVALWEMDFSSVRKYVEELKKRGVSDLPRHMTRNPESVAELQSRIELLDFNDTTLSMFRARTKEELVDSFWDIVTDSSKMSFLRCVKAFDGGELVFNGEQQNKTVDGEDVLVDLTATIAPGSEETWDRILITLQDITDRKQAEEALREYSERLEEMVQERTLELKEAHEQLVRQEKLAVLGQLAGGLGHELRNPLGAIKNSVYFLNMVLEDPDADTREMLGVLDKEADTAEKIISSLLDYARSRPPIRRKVDLNAVVRETLSTHLADAAHVDLELDLDEDLPAISGDPDQLSQVVRNIVLNGIQAMPPRSSIPRSAPNGGDRLVVRTVREGPEWARLTVEDNGEGIPEEHLAKIFEPLFTTKAKGIGLGLALVKTLVEGHGGTIDVGSEVGKGSTFTVRLPLGTRHVVESEET